MLASPASLFELPAKNEQEAKSAHLMQVRRLEAVCLLVAGYQSAERVGDAQIHVLASPPVLAVELSAFGNHEVVFHTPLLPWNRIMLTPLLGKRQETKLTLSLQDWKKPPSAETTSGKRATATDSMTDGFILDCDLNG